MVTRKRIKHGIIVPELCSWLNVKLPNCYGTVYSKAHPKGKIIFVLIKILKYVTENL
jgi:hypothetical protein